MASTVVLVVTLPDKDSGEVIRHAQKGGSHVPTKLAAACNYLSRMAATEAEFVAVYVDNTAPASVAVTSGDITVGTASTASR